MMFRRFMIVCSVLFALAVMAAGIGWAGYEYYSVKSEAIKVAIDANIAGSENRESTIEAANTLGEAK